MTRRFYIRLFIVVLAASLSLALFSYNRSRTAPDEDPTGEVGKHGQKKAQAEYILWESLTRNLLSINH